MAKMQAESLSDPVRMMLDFKANKQGNQILLGLYPYLYGCRNFLLLLYYLVGDHPHTRSDRKNA